MFIKKTEKKTKFIEAVNNYNEIGFGKGFTL
jgi:hypothetical protein